MKDIDTLVQAMAPVIKSFTEKQVDPLRLEIEQLKKRLADLPTPQKGDPGKDGKDADVSEIQKMVADAVSKIPRAKDGAPGRDGKKRKRWRRGF